MSAGTSRSDKLQARLWIWAVCCKWNQRFVKLI
jgi:hypothetical protein